MGCGVAALAGLSCDWIAYAILTAYGFLAILVLVLIGKLSDKRNLFRNRIIGTGIILSPFVWGHFSGARELTIIRAQLQEFQEICYENAHETIHRTTQDLKTLVLSPPSNITYAPNRELFFGGIRPDKWAGREIVTSPDTRTGAGVYELRYTHLPIEREIKGTPTVFHGVHIQIFDREKNEMIAERLNYLWGAGVYCLGTQELFGWFEGNLDFANRVLGDRYPRRARGQERHVKAILVGKEDVDVVLKPDAIETKPSGGAWVAVDGTYYILEDQLNRDNKDQVGWNPRIANYLKGAPHSFISMAPRKGGYIVMALPHGPVRNRPPLSILFVLLSNEVEEIQRIYVQIPPGIEWTNGWGIDPVDLAASDQTLSFKLYGQKKRVGEYSDQKNEGRYYKRYAYRVEVASIR